jgi:hypothetical protein
VYPWQDGEQVSPVGPEELPPLGEELTALHVLDDATEDLYVFLEGYGIDAHDLVSHQFIIEIDPNGQKHIRVADAERFSRRSRRPAYSGFEF